MPRQGERAWRSLGAKNGWQMTNKIEQLNFKLKSNPSPTFQETLPHPPSLPRPLPFLTQQVWQNGPLQEGNPLVKPRRKDQHLSKLQTNISVAHQSLLPDVWHSSKTATIPGTSYKGITSSTAEWYWYFIKFSKSSSLPKSRSNHTKMLHCYSDVHTTQTDFRPRSRIRCGHRRRHLVAPCHTLLGPRNSCIPRVWVSVVLKFVSKTKMNWKTMK